VSRQRVTGMRIPTTNRSKRTKRDRWTHVFLLAFTALGVVVFVAAGQPFFSIPLILIGVAYVAADLHS
jgi:hypothetical protein